ncbi:hypothetical protein CUN59_01445, partial [Cuspidothrix issatschenkoi CHARLIE-1]
MNYPYEIIRVAVTSCVSPNLIKNQMIYSKDKNMQITISIPEDIGNQLQQNWENLPQKVLESLAIEAYRNRIMNVVQIQQLLKFSSLSETE